MLFEGPGGATLRHFSDEKVAELIRETNRGRRACAATSLMAALALSHFFRRRRPESVWLQGCCGTHTAISHECLKLGHRGGVATSAEHGESATSPRTSMSS